MFTIELQGKDVIVSHPSSPEPRVLPGWTWHAELVRRLIAERDELQKLLADGASLNIALIKERDELRADAERYRWLASFPRANYVIDDSGSGRKQWSFAGPLAYALNGETLDAAIDAAREVTS